MSLNDEKPSAFQHINSFKFDSDEKVSKNHYRFWTIFRFGTIKSEGNCSSDYIWNP